MTTRIGGMASGLDTESVITALIDARRTPITAIEDRIAEEETKLSAYDTLSTKVDLLQSAALQLTLYTTWSQRSASSSDTNIATATAEAGATAGEYSFKVSTLAKAHRIATDGQSSSTEALGFTGDFTVEGQTIDVGSGDSLEDIRDAINTAALDMDDDVKVKAYIVNTSLVIERVNTGSTDINISDGTNNILQSDALGIFTGTAASPTATLKNELQEASGFSGKVNGVDITGDSNTIENAIDGITFVAKDEGTSTITVSNDTESIKSVIQDFITDYNDLLTSVKSALSVNLNSSSSAIESKGILQGDSGLSRLQDRLQGIITYVEHNPNIVDPDYNSLYKIGIWSSDETGELEIIDEDKLDAALTDHFDDVKNLFRYSGGGTNYGIAKQLDAYLGNVTDPINGSMTLSVKSLEDDISNNQTRIDEMNSALTDYENELWEHFAVMEDMVSTIQNALSYLLSALGQSS